MGFRRVLIATDGSEYTDRAIESGLEVARLAKAKVLALYVVDTSAFAAIPIDSTWEEIDELLREEGKEALRKVKERSGDLDVEEIILEGRPAEKIVDVAREKEADLIVVGTLGKSGIDKLLLGSTAERVLRTSEVPVMVVKGKSKGTEP